MSKIHKIDGQDQENHVQNQEQKMRQSPWSWLVSFPRRRGNQDADYLSTRVEM